MILEIVISNFRSIRDEQVLGFSATDSRGGNLGNLAALSGTSYWGLKSIGLYGANGSGKTNALRAIWTVRKLISSSYRLGENEDIPWYDPCVFCKRNETDGVGCRFEIEFVVPIEGVGIRFLYKIEFDASEILFESLSSFAKGREAVLFTRTSGDNKIDISFGASMRGGERKVALFKNQAYLSVAGRNPAAPAFIRSVYRYFAYGMTQIRLNERGHMLYNPRYVESQKLVRFVDLGITDMTVRKTNMDDSSVSFPADMPMVLREQFLDRIRNRYYFTHTTENGMVGEIELSEESDGTQRLFQLLPNIVETFVRGGVYIIDEIESGMHPFMSEAIVKLFNDSSINQGQAQLIFSSHNTNLLSSNIMRRDQIWFAEKVDGVSQFYSLDDFDKKTVTASGPFAKWYLEGRFGAVPGIDYASLSSAIKDILQRRRENAES